MSSAKTILWELKKKKSYNPEKKLQDKWRKITCLQNKAYDAKISNIKFSSNCLKWSIHLDIFQIFFVFLVNDNFEENSGSPQFHHFLCDCFRWQIQECLQKSVKQEKFKLSVKSSGLFVFLSSCLPIDMRPMIQQYHTQSFPQFLHQSYLLVPFWGNSLLLMLSFEVWIFSRKLKIFITHAVFSPWLLSFIFSCLLKVHKLFQQSQGLWDCELNFWILILLLFLVACL